MPKKEKEELEVIVEVTAEPQKVDKPVHEPELLAGQVLVVPVDKQGNELTEQRFVTTMSQYSKSYERFGYIIKKKN